MLLDILGTITLPLLTIIALGYVGCKHLFLDTDTLGRLFVNIVAPGGFVYFLLSSPAPISSVGFVTGYSIALFIVLYFIGWLIMSLFITDILTRRACALAIAFPNSGPFGIPLVNLAFGDQWLFHQSVIASVHSVLIVVLVPLLVPLKNLGIANSLYSAFKSPLLPSVIVGIAIKLIDLDVPVFVMVPLEMLGDALTPLALLTLGTQIAVAPRIADPVAVTGVVSLRLVAAPLVTAASFLAFDTSLSEREYLLVNACVPVGVVLSVLLAEQKKVSQTITTAVAVSTALSPFAVTVVLAFM